MQCRSRAPASCPPGGRFPSPSRGAWKEPATQYVAGHTPNGGLFALLHGRGVLKMVRNRLPFSMFDELVGAVGGSQRELAAMHRHPGNYPRAQEAERHVDAARNHDRLVRIARLEEMAAAIDARRRGRRGAVAAVRITKLR